MATLINTDGTPMQRTASELVVLPTSKPFDRHRGEAIGALGFDFVVVPMSKWADTALPKQAIDVARKVFTRKATNTTIPNLRIDDETILIQEYRRQDRIAVVVAAWGRQMGMRKWGWLYHTTVFKIEGDIKRQLVMAGRWQPTQVTH
jgi:hypothetical protein